MAGKPITRGSGRVGYAIDQLSKNTLADIILDRIAAEIGEDATDEQVLAHLQPWLDTIQRLRADKPVNLIGLLGRLDRAEAAFRERLKREQEQRAIDIETGQRLKEKIDEINRDKLKEPIR